MPQGNFNKYRVKENTDKPQVMADPILKFFNGGFLMPAKQGGILAYPNNNNQSGYVAPRMNVGGAAVGIYGYRNYNNDILSNKKYGGGLLSRTVTCSDCGWSWKAIDGGKAPMTCHKCGGMIKMKNGGDISIPNLNTPNWLSKYDEGGIKDPPLTNADAERQFILNWNNSPMAQQMLQASVDKDDPWGRNSVYVNDIRNARNTLAKKAQVKLLPQDQLIKLYESLPGSDESSTGLGGFAYSKFNMPKLIGSNFLSAFSSPFLANTLSKNQAYSAVDAYNLNAVQPKIYIDSNNKDQISESKLHELSHASDLNGKLIPDSDVKKMNTFARGIKGAPAPILNEFDQYVAKPSETRARLMNLRFNANNQKLYNPFTQKATIDVLKKYEGNGGENYQFDPLYQLRSIYSDEEILNMLNSISKTKQPLADNNPNMAKYGGWLNKYAFGGFATTETTTINPQDIIPTIQNLRNDSNFINELKRRPIPEENYPNNKNRKQEPLDPRFITLEKKPVYSPFFNPRDFDKHALKSFDVFKEPQTYKNGGWLDKYDDGGFATTETTTINPNTVKKFPTPFKPNTNNNTGGYNFYTQNGDDSYKLVTEQDWENQQSKDGVKKNITPVKNTANIKWRNGTVSKLPSGTSQKITTGSQPSEKEKFAFENPYKTPNPNLNDMVGSPDYWWSEIGWNPQKQQTVEGMSAFARLYPAFATVNPDLEWTTSSDGKGAWKKRTHPWEIPGTPQYNALMQIKELEDEKNMLIGKTAIQLLDPTGVSMWGDTWQSYKDLYNDPGLWNTAVAGINTVASLPLVRYLGEEAIAPVKGAEATAKVAEITAKLDKLYTQYPQLTKFQKAKNAVIGGGKQALNFIGNSQVGQVLHYIGGEPFIKRLDKATGAEKLFKLPTTGNISSFNKMERFGKASINLPINMYSNNQDIKDLKNLARKTSEEYFTFKREDGSVFQINKEIQDKQLPGSIPFDAIDPDYNGEDVIIPLMSEKKLKDRELYIPAMYNTSQKKQTKLKKLPNKK